MSSSAFRARAAEIGLALALALCVMGSVPAARASQVYIDITKEADRRVTVAVSPLAPEESPEQKELREILERDLALAGYFRLLPMGSLQQDLYRIEQESGRLNFASWLSWGAELLVRTRFHRERGKAVLEGKLFDTGQGTMLLGREYRGEPDQGPRAVHTFVNDIVKTLTGEEGIALTRIVLTWADGGPKRIAIMDYDGRNIRPVSPEGVLSLYPSWFPDGKRISYVSYRHGRTEVVVHDLETGRIRSLAFFPGMNAFPSVSPDGRHVLLALSRDGNPEIYRMAVDGSSLKRLTFTKAVEASPVWSPDQRQIAFVSDRTGSPQIFVSSDRGGNARRVSFTGHYSTSPDWSPKGAQIAFTSMIDGTFQLFAVDLESGENVRLTSDGGNKEDPSWAPDSRHVIYSQGRGSTYQLIVLDTRTGERFPLPRSRGSLASPSWSR